MSAGGAVGVSPAGSAPQVVRVGVEHSRQLPAPAKTAAPVPVVVVEPNPPGVDVTKPVSTAAVVDTAKVDSHPRLQVSASSSAPWLVSGRLPTAGLMAAGTVAQADQLTGLATSIPAGQSRIPGLLSHVPAACVGTGSDGNRVQVLYVVEADKVNRFAAVEASLASFAADVDDVFALSSRKTDSGRRVRWVQDGLCNISVLNVTLPAGSLGTSANTSGAFNGMVAALKTAGYEISSRKYLAFADAAALCGIAEKYNDSAKIQNYNDGTVPMYARVDSQCWSTQWTGTNTPAHELMHSLGAVQPDAPNATAYGHCTDDSDTMCYVDSSGKPMRQMCPVDQEALFDCGDNDYFNPGAGLDPGSYLGSHWNTADSSYLTSVPGLAPMVGFTGKAPTRVLNTLNGTGAAKAKLGAGRTLTLRVPGLPAGTTAVAINVMVTNPTAKSYLTVYPGGTARPGASNLNFVAGQTIPNLVMVPLGPGNTITFFNRYGTVNVLGDLVGYYQPRTGAGFTGKAPTRVLNTLNGTGAAKAKLGAGRTLTLRVPGLPAGTTAVAINVMVTNPTAKSYLTVYPGGTGRPGASNLNFVAGQTIPNLVMVPLGPGNTVTFYNSAGTVNVLGDLVGYYQPGTGAGFAGKAPTRVLNTLNGTGVRLGKLGAGRTLTLRVPGLPAGTTAVAINVMATNPTATSYLTVYPGGTGRPGASNLNFVAGQTIPNLVLVPLGPGGHGHLLQQVRHRQRPGRPRGLLPAPHRRGVHR
jgi:hypothetical protein